MPHPHTSAPTNRTDATPSKPDVHHRLQTAVQYKNQANAHFAASRLDDALKAWHHALLYSAGINSLATLYGARSTEEQNDRARDVTLAVWNNMAACYLQQERWEKAILVTTKVLAVQPKNLKALYRRTKAHLGLDALQAAAQDLDTALDASPNDPALRKLAEELVGRVEPAHGQPQEG
ncbi:hypothetical protein ACQY0O_005379 [Thecaphora frezii]